MANGHDPQKPPADPGTGSGGGVTPLGGSDRPPQTKAAVVATAAAVGGLIGGVVGALIGSGMH